MDFQYEIIRSQRKTVSIQIKPDGQVIVRCPKRMGNAEVRKLVESRRAWIEKKLTQAAPKETAKFTDAELEKLRELTRKLVTPRVEYYGNRLGVRYGRIAIRAQHTRWGSCSGKGNLNFNCLLALVPEAVLDYIVVHELCHRKEFNHSERFWAEVERVLPDYRVQKKWLQENGKMLMAKLV